MTHGLSFDVLSHICCWPRILIASSKVDQTLSFLCLQPPASFSLAPAQWLVSLALKVVLGMIFSLKEVVLGMKDEWGSRLSESIAERTQRALVGCHYRGMLPVGDVSHLPSAFLCPLRSKERRSRL